MRATTRAAEGYDRRAFTVKDVLAMQDAGILADEERFELIEGEIVPRQAKGPLHERIKSALTYHMVRALPDAVWFGVESTLYVSDDTFLEPDLMFFPARFAKTGPKGADVLLAIEVAASSLAYDPGLKAQLYARYKIKEYWVIDAERRTTFQFFEPHSPSWRRRIERGPDEVLQHAALPNFSLRLSDV